ncbi:Uu.00g139140.m01.CDS01 [Anthostomella pinea]|uniref:Uu.00g139140.m01.CDS01 n=1 Tax=Anthostomella pinea TaxID=933095 RepID=A0AAI8VPU7_9PEZI|nr:Uu.00g139140.m01.CDS01 [Anthostomella pinea]
MRFSSSLVTLTLGLACTVVGKSVESALPIAPDTQTNSTSQTNGDAGDLYGKSILASRAAYKWRRENAGQWSEKNLRSTLCDKDLKPTSWDKPVLSWSKKSPTSPKNYLPRIKAVNPRSTKVDDWLKNFYAGSYDWLKNFYGGSSSGEKSESKHDDESRTTIVTALYSGPEEESHTSIETYLRRLNRLVDTGQPMLVYCEPSLKPKIASMREEDKDFQIVTEFETIWDVPTNKDQKGNFNVEQWNMFWSFKPASHKNYPDEGFNFAFFSAVYNAKAYFLWHAVNQNRIRSDTWMWVDAGLLGFAGEDDGTVDEDLWKPLQKDFIDPTKVKNAVEIVGDGVVMSLYPDWSSHPPANFNNPCWDPSQKTATWQCVHFLSGLVLGTSVAMLDFAVKYMQTFDEMDANGLYVGREEVVLPFLAARYPEFIWYTALLPTRSVPEEIKFMRVPGLAITWSGWPKEYIWPGQAAPRDPIKEVFCDQR